MQYTLYCRFFLKELYGLYLGTEGVYTKYYMVEELKVSLVRVFFVGHCLQTYLKFLDP
jgi:hypothetical protein